MRHKATVDSVKVQGDEDGEHLLVTTIDGDEFDFKLPSDIAKRLAFEETLPIRLHWEEGERIRQGRPWIGIPSGK